MAYLGVGIHENVILDSKTGINEKGSLVLEFATKVDSNNMYAAFADGTEMEASSVGLIQFPFNMTNWEGKAKTASEIGTDINNLKANLIDILSVFMTSDKAKAAIGIDVVFRGLGITPETQASLPQRLLNADFVATVYKNICNAFIAAATPYFNTAAFRLKLRRTSKAKHYSSIPPRTKFAETWIESMAVPKDQSKISWSKYEIDNGLNSGVKTETDAVSTTEDEKVANMFAPPVAPAPQTFTPPAEAQGFTDVNNGTAAVNPFNQ